MLVDVPPHLLQDNMLSLLDKTTVKNKLPTISPDGTHQTDGLPRHAVMSAQVVAFTPGKYHMHNSSWSRVDIALHKS